MLNWPRYKIIAFPVEFGKDYDDESDQRKTEGKKR